ncbi:MAG: hypothetical protein HFE90_07185 [Firmicutes bacterium]|nr:hypothetical protein [Bacillota bacterium]
MKQLINIESIPLKLDIKTTWARFEKMSPMDKLSKVNSPARNNKSNVHSYKNASNTIKQNSTDVYEAKPQNVSPSYADMLSSQAAAINNSEQVSEFVFSSPLYMNAAVQNNNLQAEQDSYYDQEGQENFSTDMMAKYSVDRANFDMNIMFGLQDFEFVPASVEFTVSQRPEVRIEYIGTPIYVPPSTDPEYVDIMA